MSTEADRCPFRADMIVMTRGGGYQRIKDVQCIQEVNHTTEGMPGDREHEFLTAFEHTFGAHWEKGRWVTRR